MFNFPWNVQLPIFSQSRHPMVLSQKTQTSPMQYSSSNQTQDLQGLVSGEKAKRV